MKGPVDNVQNQMSKHNAIWAKFVRLLGPKIKYLNILCNKHLGIIKKHKNLKRAKIGPTILGAQRLLHGPYLNL
jgi:hypothetical protein